MAVTALTLAMTVHPFTTTPDRTNPTPDFDGLTAGQTSDHAHDQYNDA